MKRVSTRKARERLVVFTDLDGTLLDHDTYSYAEAKDALDLLKHRNIPLVLCSSKTRAEIERLRKALCLPHPFISENGGAIYIPAGYFAFRAKGARKLRKYDVIAFGASHGKLVETLHRVARQLGIRISGFSDMSVGEVARDCGLSMPEARLAKQREYDEPFRILDSRPDSRQRLFAALRRAGLRCIQGGRYNHVTGVTDKGLAIRRLWALYKRAWGPVRTMGLGDGLNDVPLLREVDIPVIVRNPAGGVSEQLVRIVPGAILTRAAGPRGWNHAVLAESEKCMLQ